MALYIRFKKSLESREREIKKVIKSRGVIVFTKGLSNSTDEQLSCKEHLSTGGYSY